MRLGHSAVEASSTQPDCVLTLKSSLLLMLIPKRFADFYRSAVEMKTKHYQRKKEVKIHFQLNFEKSMRQQNMEKLFQMAGTYLRNFI